MTGAARSVGVRVSRRFRHPAERVFDAWLDPATVGRWLFATPTGTMVRVELDARVGGSYAIVERRAGEEVEHRGEYLALDRPRRLAFTLSVPRYGEDVDRITVEIAPLGEGCELTLTDEMRPELAEEHGARAASGWSGVLDALAAALR